MKLYNYLEKTLSVLLFLCSTIYAQLELSVYTDKDIYQYGEQIELYCKVTNNSDTTFEFFAGSYQSCQAEFSFNDFNSWEHTACLATMELLTFKPHSSKIYSWKIEPSESGLPNNDGTQMIIGNYLFGLVDTIYITAPLYLGGQLSVGFPPANADSVNSIKDSLNITVLNHSDYGTVISELWQIEGFQIDSVINHFQRDSILTYIENAVFVMYDKIFNENPLAFYPLHVGDIRQYIVEYNPGTENGRDTSYYFTEEIVGLDTLNGNVYFKINNSESGNVAYIRIDSTNSTVCKLNGDIECMLDSLSMDVSKNGFTNECYGSVHCIKDSIKTVFSEERRVKTYNYSPAMTIALNKKYQYAYGIGLISSSTTYANTVPDEIIETLVYAKINGKEYGIKTDIKDFNNNLPTKFSLSQNYPNPFNPTTTIKYSISSTPSPLLRGVGGVLTTLKIYDILGREVATLVNNEQKPGNYEVQFDASNLTSGIYFYKLQSSSFVESKKMILIK